MENNRTRTYTVTWHPASSNNVKNKSEILGTSTTITGLKSNTPYSFTLTAVNEAGGGKTSNATLIKTGKKLILVFY